MWSASHDRESMRKGSKALNWRTLKILRMFRTNRGSFRITEPNDARFQESGVSISKSWPPDWIQPEQTFSTAVRPPKPRWLAIEVCGHDVGGARGSSTTTMWHFSSGFCDWCCYFCYSCPCFSCCCCCEWSSSGNVVVYNHRYEWTNTTTRCSWHERSTTSGQSLPLGSRPLTKWHFA